MIWHWSSNLSVELTAAQYAGFMDELIKYRLPHCRHIYLQSYISCSQLTVALKACTYSYKLNCFLFSGVTRIGRDDAPVPQDITIDGHGIEAEHCRIENRGGVITLDPCGHLCSLDGVPVTRPTQLTQGNRNMIALQWKCIYSMHVFVCLLWKTQCLSKWKGEEVYDLGMKCVMYWKCIMCLSSRVLVLDVTQSLIGVVLDLFLMQHCDSELPEVLEWATELSFSSPRLYFPIIPAFFSLTEFLTKRSINLYAYFLSHLSESESDKHLPDLFWHFSVMKCKYWRGCEMCPPFLSLFLWEGLSTGMTVMQMKTNFFLFLNAFRKLQRDQFWKN